MRVLGYEKQVAQRVAKRLGGSGSGNFNHEGRPGEIGGSGEGNAAIRNEHLFAEKWIGNELPFSEKITHIERDTKFPTDKAVKVVHATRDFTENYYKEVRANKTPLAQKHSAILEEYIHAAPKFTAPTYRGVVMPEEAILNTKVGDKINMNGLSSWTSEESRAARFGKAQQMTSDWQGTKRSTVVFAVSNSKNATAIDHISSNPPEKEVLVSSKQNFKVASIEKMPADHRTVEGFYRDYVKVNLQPI